MSLLCNVAAIFALVSLLVTGPALAAEDAGLKAKVQALFNQAAASFQKRDMAGVLAISLPDAVIQYRDGRSISLAKWAQGVAEDLPNWTDVKSRYLIKKAWSKGGGMAGALYQERHEFGRTRAPGHRFAIAARFAALLTKTPKGWRVKKFIEKETKFFKDGKALKPKSAS